MPVNHFRSLKPTMTQVILWAGLLHHYRTLLERAAAVLEFIHGCYVIIPYGY